MTPRKMVTRSSEPEHVEVDTEGRSLGERLARVEAEIKHMATKAELANMSVLRHSSHLLPTRLR